MVLVIFFEFLSGMIGICGILAAVASRVGRHGVLDFLFCVLVACPFLALTYLLNRVCKKAQEKKESKILRTRIVDTSGRTSTSSAVGRSAVGGFVAGPVGAVVGASTAKQNRETTFLITYQNGTKKTKKVPNNSVEYEMYCKFLDA